MVLSFCNQRNFISVVTFRIVQRTAVYPSNPDDIGEIFANAEEILSFNEQLLRKLVDDVHNHRCIGLTFQGATDMLETYLVYVKNYHKAMKRWIALFNRA